MRLPCPGDRLELIVMTDDPDPVPAGTKGTVKFVRWCKTGRNAWLQVDVDWDNGRQLMLVVPPDRFEFLAFDVTE